MVVEAKEISDKHHVARYCSGSRHLDGEVSPKAFVLRPGETHLSVNWLEYFGLDSLDEALVRVCADKREQITIRPTGRFALLRAGDVRSVRIDVDALSGTARYLTVTHIPQEGDESHSGIGGYGADEMGRMVAADLLAEKVNAVSYGLRPPPMTS